MPKKRLKPEQVVTASQACKEAKVTEQTYYRWRKEYGRLRLDMARGYTDSQGRHHA